MGILNFLKKGFGKAAIFVSTHSHGLMTIGEISAMVGAVYSGVAVTPGSVRMIDAENLKREQERIPPMDGWEIVKLVGPRYIVTALLVCVSGGFAIWNLVTADRELAAAGLACSVLEKSLDEQRVKTAELIGEKREQRIRDEIAKDNVAMHPASGSQIIVTGDGDYLCYESWTGVYFRSNIEKVRMARLDIREAIDSDPFGSITFNEAREYMKLPPVDSGYDLVWDSEDNLDFYYTSMLSDTGDPCLSIGYQPYPHPKRR